MHGGGCCCCFCFCCDGLLGRSIICFFLSDANVLTGVRGLGLGLSPSPSSSLPLLPLALAIPVLPTPELRLFLLPAAIPPRPGALALEGATSWSVRSSVRCVLMGVRRSRPPAVGFAELVLLLLAAARKGLAGSSEDSSGSLALCSWRFFSVRTRL
jgi:hypothetical protein